MRHGPQGPQGPQGATFTSSQGLGDWKTIGKLLKYNDTGWGPPVISWLISGFMVDITIVNRGYNGL